MTHVYVVDVLRTPVGKAPRGVFKNMLPDDLLRCTIQALQHKHETLDWALIRDVVIGCAMPEAEQGMNIARIASLLSGLPESVPAMTINRFCSSGVQSIATAGAGLPQGSEPALALAGATGYVAYKKRTGRKSKRSRGKSRGKSKKSSRR